MKKDEIPSKDIVQIIRDEISIVSFMLFFVTFLFKINFDTRGVYALPILLFLVSSLLILYGILLRIASVIINDIDNLSWMDLPNKLDLASKGFHILGVIFFIASCHVLVTSIQGINSLPSICQHIQVAVINLGRGLVFILIILILVKYSLNKSW